MPWRKRKKKLKNTLLNGTGCTFTQVFLLLCSCSEWLGQCKGWPDHIPDYNWAEPGQANSGKTTAEWRLHFSGVLSSGGPGSALLRSSLDATAGASLFLEVCMYSGFWWPTHTHKAKRIDNRLHELGHAGQTNTPGPHAQESLTVSLGVECW